VHVSFLSICCGASVVNTDADRAAQQYAQQDGGRSIREPNHTWQRNAVFVVVNTKDISLQLVDVSHVRRDASNYFLTEAV
jgi:hypothetical protein